jgi:regulator of sirC expression with transglutaminase-like and TPR domain
MRAKDVEAFLHSAADPHARLAEGALLMARVEYPRLDPGPYLQRLDEIGRAARAHIEQTADATNTPEAVVSALAAYLYGVLGFSGNSERYNDPDNSLLNQVIDRRTGIPITLAVVLMEVGAVAGVPLEGVNFPRHFLVRAEPVAGQSRTGIVLVDPFNGGAILSESDCAALLGTGEDAETAALTPAMFATAGKRDILVRMLMNIKAAYVRQHSYPHARDAVDLLLGLDPTLMSEVRDRALLSYRLGDFAAALRDAERYLQVPPAIDDPDARTAHEQMWEQVKGLRKRIAGFN